MAKKNGTQFTYADGHKLLTLLDVSQLRALLERTFPEHITTQVSPNSVKINCLAGAVTGHVDTHPSMYIDVKRGTIKCKACGFFSRNLLQLYQDAKGWSYRETLLQVHTHTGRRLVSEKVEAEVEAYDVHNTAISTMLWVCSTYAQRMKVPPIAGADAKNYDELTRFGAKASLDWLFEHRRHKFEHMPQLPYGLWPPQQLMLEYAHNFLEAQATAQYERFQNTTLTPERREKVLLRIKALIENVGTEWLNAVAFFNGHGLRTPGKIRLRRPHLEDTKDGNYYTLPGFTDDEPLGYFGLFAPHLGGLDPSDAKTLQFYLVEGENDAISCQEHFFDNGLTGYVFIASNGAFNELDTLLDAGIDTIYAISDHTVRGKGDEWMRGRLLTANTISVKVFRGWVALDSVPGQPKDPDEVMQYDGFPVFKRTVVDEAAKWFVPVDVWALENAVAESAGIAENDVIARTSLAVRHGEAVRNPAQQGQYVELVCKALKLSPGLIRSKIASSGDDEEGFLARTVDALQRVFYTIYKESSTRGPILWLHHRDADRTVAVSIADTKAAVANMCSMIGDLFNFFSDQIGLPTWIVPQSPNQAATPRRAMLPVLGDYLMQALLRVLPEVPDKASCAFLGPGFHVCRNAESVQGVDFFIVNGRSVYHGVYVSEESNQLSWVRLSGPALGRHVFLTDPEELFPELRSVTDLEEANKVTLEDVRAVINKITNVYATGWRTLYGALDAKFLAYFVASICTPYSHDKIHVELVGQPSSGKSTMLSTLAGGQIPALKLAPWGRTHSNYTAASVYNSFNSSTLTLGLEEFTRDVGSSAKSNSVTAINDLLRQIIFEGGASIIRTLADGSVGVKRLNMHVVTASILAAPDVQDSSRRFTVETTKVDGHADPAIVFRREFPPAEIERVRKILALGLIKYERQYSKLYNPIKEELGAGRLHFSAPVDTRFLRNFAPIAPLMQMVGDDWRDFVVKTSEARMNKLQSMARTTMSSTLFDVIFRTPSVRVGANNAMSSVSALVGNTDPATRTLLNKSQCGVYYLENHKFLVVDWITAVSPNGILFRTDPFGRMPHNALRNQMEQHLLHLRPHEYDVAEVVAVMRTLGVSLAPTELTVLNIGQLVDDLRAASLGTSGMQTSPVPNVVDLPGVASRRNRSSGGDDNI